MLSALRTALVVALGALASGCAYVYQPMSGLHRPVIVDIQRENLSDVRLSIVCVPEALLTRTQANQLCTKLRTLFENQGARVATSLGEPPEFEGDDATVEGLLDLRLVVRAQETHRSLHPWSWGAFAFTFSIVPGVVESTFSQDLELRDGTGFLLAREQLSGRIVESYGAGAWVGNVISNLGRKKVERGPRVTASQELSADLYRSMSQTVFDARMRATVLRAAERRP